MQAAAGVFPAAASEPERRGFDPPAAAALCDYLGARTAGEPVP